MSVTASWNWFYQATTDPLLQKIENLKASEPTKFDSILREFFQGCIQQDKISLFNRCFDRIDFNLLETTLKKLSPNFQDIFTSATRKFERYQILKNESQHFFSEDVKRELKRILRQLIHSFCAILDLLIKTINIIKMGKPPQTWYETSDMLSVIAFLATPFYLYELLKPVLVTTLKTSVVFTAALIIGSAGLYAYNKWWRPLPIWIPEEFGQNRSEAARNAEVPRPIGRDQEANRVENSLASNSSRLAKIPIILAKSGTGKTSLINLLAYRTSNHTCHQKMFNGIDVYVTNGGILSPSPNDFGKPRYDLLLERIRSDAIVVIEEFHAIADTTGLNIIERIKTSLGSQIKYVIATSTPEEWARFKKKIPDSAAFLGRVNEIFIEDTEEEIKKLTISILKEEAYNLAPETLIPDSIFEQIYTLTNEQDFHEAQPKRSIYVLDQLLSSIRIDLHSNPKLEGLDKKLSSQTKDCQDALFALKTQKNYGQTLDSQANLETQTKVDQLKKDILATENEIKEHKATLAKYKKLIRIQKEINTSLAQLAEKIVRLNQTKKHVSENLRKQFLLTNYYLLPALDKEIEKIENDYQLKIPITLEMVQKLILELSKKKVPNDK